MKLKSIAQDFWRHWREEQRHFNKRCRNLNTENWYVISQKVAKLCIILDENKTMPIAFCLRKKLYMVTLKW